ncbi:MAG: hypothetical protein PF904_12780 [Kiritimatiellae bacterium]|jgi:KDO2-lipid IV(A) lauroyltransferase|nr:hypothetical protein [Kiritimatiellia bacterium]
MRYKAKHIIEYAGLRAITAFFNLLPYGCAINVSRGFAWLMFNVGRFRREETFKRIREVMGSETPESRIKEIAWLSLRNMVFNMIEMMRASKIDKAWIDKHIPGFAEQVKEVPPLIEKYGGAVIAVPHTGNWDLAGWACYEYGIKMFSIAAKQKNPLVNAWINRQRESGMTILERGGGTLKQIIRLLRKGSVLAILPDVRVYTPDLEVDFLGSKANLGRGMAQFAITAKVPIIPAIFKRCGSTIHKGTRFDPILPDPELSKEDNIREMTEKVIALVDKFIRDEPEQWFWYNKRWILTPVHKKKQQNLIKK